MNATGVIQMILVLAMLLGLIYLALWSLKKYMFAFDKKRAKLVKIKVLSTQMIMPKKFIQVVQVHDRVLVLGISDHSINVLDKFEDFANDLIESDEEQPESEQFSHKFIENLKKNLGMR